MKSNLRILWLFFALTFTSGIAFAQFDTATVLGMVLDPSKLPIGRSSVTLSLRSAFIGEIAAARPA